MKLDNQRVTTFLTFGGNAEQAMQFYASVLPGAKIQSIERYQKGQPGKEGTVLNGVLSLMDTEIFFMDIEVAEPPPIGWGTSFLVSCKDEAEFDSFFLAVSEEGIVMMGPEPVLQMRKVAWVTDKFGVTWQPVWE